MQLSIRNQLLLAFAVTLLLTVAVSWVGISQASALNDRAALLYDENLLSSSHIADLGRFAIQDRAAELEHVLATDSTGKAGYQDEINSLDKEVDRGITGLKAADGAGQLAAPIA